MSPIYIDKSFRAINSLKIFYLVLLISFSLISCLDDVPHDNPLDSQSKKYGFTINGKVRTLYAPVKLISNAVITLLPVNTKFFSNNEGNFEITGLLPGEYTVHCTSDGFAQDSININLQSNMDIDFFLDGLPFFEKIIISTHQVTRSFPVEAMFFLQLDVQVSDLDGIADINSVFFEIPELNVIDTLEASLTAGLFSKRLSIDDLPVNTIHTLIGRTFLLNVSDDAGITTKSDKRFLTRVIEETPIPTQPISFQTVVSDSIQFIWEKVRPPYWFTHTIEIFLINQQLLTKVFEIKNISGTDNTIMINAGLPSGDYVWILTITDEFGNTSSSSKEATFHVN